MTVTKKLLLKPNAEHAYSQYSIPKIPRKKYKNVLKFNETIKYFIKDKYGIREDELNLLIFFYDEPYFSSEAYRRYTSALSFDKIRLVRLIDKGLIMEYNIKASSGKIKKVYILSDMASDIVENYYDVITGKEMTLSYLKNKRNEFNQIPFIKKAYIKLIEKINSIRRIDEKSYIYEDIQFRPGDLKS